MNYRPKKDGCWPYEEFVNLPHHVSAVHPQMDPAKRAAQFAPFAALTGYEDAVAETARLTEEELLLDENVREELNRKMTGAAESGAMVRITWFVPDGKKNGGEYVESSGVIRKIEEGSIVLENGTRIPAEHIAAITEETCHV